MWPGNPMLPSQTQGLGLGTRGPWVISPKLIGIFPREQLTIGIRGEHAITRDHNTRQAQPGHHPGLGTNKTNNGSPRFLRPETHQLVLSDEAAQLRVIHGGLDGAYRCFPLIRIKEIGTDIG